MPENEIDRWECGACGALWLHIRGRWFRQQGATSSAEELEHDEPEKRCTCGAPRPSQPGILEAEKAKADNPPVEKGHAVVSNQVGQRDVSLDEMLHPNGRCTCAGEGKCEWCLRSENEIASERQSRERHSPRALPGTTARALREADEHVYCRKNPIPKGGHECNCQEGMCFAAAIGLRKTDDPPIHVRTRLAKAQMRVDDIHLALKAITLGNSVTVLKTIESLAREAVAILNEQDDEWG